jgi:hypothetical protein
MADITVGKPSYGSASTAVTLQTMTSGTALNIHGIEDPSKVGLFVQTTVDGTKLTMSSTDVDYSGADTGDLDITVAATSAAVGNVFVGPFDGTRFLVETSTGSYMTLYAKATTTGGTGSASIAAFQL